MIETTILAVPERLPLVIQLRERLGQELPVHLDTQHVGHADAYRTAMDWSVERATDATHVMVIEDDAWPCEGFLEAAEHVLQFVPPDEPATFFTRVRGGHGHWLRLRNGFINTQACVWPIETWQAVSAWMGSQEGQHWRRAHTHRGPGPMPRGRMRTICADNWWSEWMRVHRMSAWATVPSLVQHRPVASIIAHHHIGQAACYVGDSLPRAIDWSQGAPLLA